MSGELGWDDADLDEWSEADSRPVRRRAALILLLALFGPALLLPLLIGLLVIVSGGSVELGGTGSLWALQTVVIVAVGAAIAASFLVVRRTLRRRAEADWLDDL